MLGPKVRLQAPPNLVDLEECRALLGAGVDDWGGVSPLTPDHVNPERPWPSLERLRSITEQSGFELRARLTVHPEYVVAGEPWIDPRVSGHVAALADDDGLVRDGVRPTGLPWQEPDGGFASVGRTDLHEAVDDRGAAPTTAAPTSTTSTATGTPCVRWLRRARNEPVSKPPDQVVSRRSLALAPQPPKESPLSRRPRRTRATSPTSTR